MRQAYDYWQDQPDNYPRVGGPPGCRGSRRAVALQTAETPFLVQHALSRTLVADYRYATGTQRASTIGSPASVAFPSFEAAARVAGPFVVLPPYWRLGFLTATPHRLGRPHTASLSALAVCLASLTSRLYTLTRPKFRRRNHVMAVETATNVCVCAATVTVPGRRRGSRREQQDRRRRAAAACAGERKEKRGQRHSEASVTSHTHTCPSADRAREQPATRHRAEAACAGERKEKRAPQSTTASVDDADCVAGRTSVKVQWRPVDGASRSGDVTRTDKARSRFQTRRYLSS